MSQPPTRDQLVLVDGSGYIFRAFHGLPMMTRPDGTPINAVFGFTKMLLSYKIAMTFCYLQPFSRKTRTRLSFDADSFL